jgi:hypothetical protein
MLTSLINQTMHPKTESRTKIIHVASVAQKLPSGGMGTVLKDVDFMLLTTRIRIRITLSYEDLAHFLPL